MKRGTPLKSAVDGVAIALALLTPLALQPSSTVSAQASESDQPELPAQDTSVSESQRPDSQVQEVTPPTVLTQVEATYPEEALAEAHEAWVVLFVTVGVSGAVTAVEVAESGGHAFDEAAMAAVRRWRFVPAQRAELPVASRIRVPFTFSPPVAPTVESTPVPAEPADPALPEEQVLEVTVQGERALRAETRGAGDARIERDVLIAAPRQEGAEILRTAPGLYIGRAGGDAVAHSYMLRGFDAEHGQDIAFHVGGLPINMPAHIHGQGYADLGFLIPEVVQRLDVIEGVHDPRQGDFAVAGSLDLALGVAPEARGIQLRSSFGRFGQYRQLALWAPPGGETESFGAAQYTRTDGFGEQRASKSGSMIFQHRFGSGALRYRFLGIAHTARGDRAGVLRQDDIDAGRVCFQCAYDLPTARAQNALAQRVLGGVFADYAALDGANGQLGAWFGYDGFRTQQNFTGFVESSRTLERVAGRGDLIEQRNRSVSVGLKARYRTAPFRPASWAHGTIEIGTDGRFDHIEQSQNLIDAAVRSQTWDRRVDASIHAVDLGAFGDLDWQLGRYVEARLGVRADLLSYEVDDRLGNFVALTRPQDSFLPGFRRSALGLAYGPRTSVAVQALPWLTLLATYGEGFRSPQARTLEDGEETPFTKVRAADVGARFSWGRANTASVSAFYTQLSDDVAFDASEGRLERVGATQRLGAVAHVQSRPTSWLVASASCTFVDATLREPPPPTAEEPQPAFEKGQRLPFVPPVVLRSDLGVRHPLTQFWGQTLMGHAGLGFSFLSPRPLPFDESAEPVSLLDASAGLSWGIVDADFALFNALNSRYAALEYNFASDWNPTDGVRPRTPARHIAAGAPLSWMLSLGVRL